MSRILIKCLQPRLSDLSWRPLPWLSARWCTPAPSGSLCSSPPECVTKLIWTNLNRILTIEPQSSSLPHSSSCFMGGILRLRRNGPQVWRIKNTFIYHLLMFVSTLVGMQASLQSSWLSQGLPDSLKVINWFLLIQKSLDLLQKPRLRSALLTCTGSCNMSDPQYSHS